MKEFLRSLRVMPALVLLACSQGSPEDASDPPVIDWFSAKQAKIEAGRTTILEWSVSDASSLSIAPDVGSVDDVNWVVVSPSETITYTLTASNSAGSETATATVTVDPVDAPVIASFVATPPAIATGESTTLSWEVSGATSLRIDPDIGEATGTSIEVSPSETTTYTLNARNAADAVIATATVTVGATAGGKFISVGDMTVKRAYATATLLPNGKVLIAGGGFESEGGASAELYDPGEAGISGSFVATASMSRGRWESTAFLLRDGTVVIAGGSEHQNDHAAVIELYDPEANDGMGGFTSKPGPANIGGSLTLLDNDLILDAGGYYFRDLQMQYTYYAEATLFDPSGNPGSESFTSVESMSIPRVGATATLLPSGKVLIAGGYDDYGSRPVASAELFDPETSSFTLTGSMVGPRAYAAAILLPSGKVLVVGGKGPSSSVLATAELFDPDGDGGTGDFSAIASLSTARFSPTATLLQNGKVLVAGGAVSSGTFLSSAELYDPAGNGAQGEFEPTASMTTARGGATATLLKNGDVLITGGIYSGSAKTASAELYHPE